MYGQNYQELGGLFAHHCKKCEKITIDGTQTGSFVEQEFRYTYTEVESLAPGCALFNWALQLPYWDSNAQAFLVLSISTNSEDLAYLDAKWHGCQSFAALDGTAQTRLSIFAAKGSLRLNAYLRP
jgi:alpha-L-fucosidase